MALPVKTSPDYVVKGHLYLKVNLCTKNTLPSPILVFHSEMNLYRKDTLVSVKHRFVLYREIQSQCKKPVMSVWFQWLDSKVLGWLNLVYSGNRKYIYLDCIAGFKGRLLHFLYETFARTQIEQLFNIIIEYPESEPAILDLKVCLEKTDLRTLLVTSLKSALETRLLHPGIYCTS